MNDFKDKNVAVIGFGIEGKDAISFLAKQGAKVTLLDNKEESQIDFSVMKDLRFKKTCGPNYLQDLGKFDLIVRSAGVYPFQKELLDARDKGSKITSVMQLFFDRCTSKIIGVTGTKGKGTTCTLIYKILKESGRDVYLAGNIGEPFLELLPVLNEDSLVVLELSSFQLIDLSKSPQLAVVLNITTDHLDWHKNRDEYVDAKKNIARFQTHSDYCVVNADYGDSKAFENLGEGAKYYFSRKRNVKGAYATDEEIILSVDKIEKIGNTYDLIIRGRHNWENVTAAICVSALLGAPSEVIRKCVFSFKGLEHRLEYVGDTDGISFYNDSFATCPDPTIAAINSFSEPITLILGGYDKGLDYKELVVALKVKKNIKNIVLIGDLSEKLGNMLESIGARATLHNLYHASMKEIVVKAMASTKDGGIVLLSPAAASFDMFENYKDRGNQFKKAIKKL